MEKKRSKLLVVADGVVPTGFARVVHNIIKNLPTGKIDVHHLAINYFGDPHDENWKIYPASVGGDLWGFNRLEEFLYQDFDCIFMVNDPWVISKYLHKMKKFWAKNSKSKVPIVIYTPIDAKNLDPEWFGDYDIVSQLVVYTEFAKNEVLKADGQLPMVDLNPIVIAHGVDTDVFYKLDRKAVKREILPNRQDFIDSFVFLNANRNQPRKRLELTLQGFAQFVRDKPENVKLYMHCGMRDAGIDILKLALRYKIDERLLVTSTQPGIQAVTEDYLNLVYNACEVGLNTGLGEGWGLTNHEHAATGALQIVPNHSACAELYEDCGLLLPITQDLMQMETLTSAGLVSPESVAEQMEVAYSNKELYKTLSDKCYNKFTSKEYNWDYITETYWTPLILKTIDA